jgi:hypothetical protein
MNVGWHTGAADCHLQYLGLPVCAGSFILLIRPAAIIAPTN